jgi:hypothetical protein
MPLESSLFFAPYSNEYAEQQEGLSDNSDDRNWYKEELDRKMGRTPKSRSATSIEELIQDQTTHGIGKEENGNR